MYICFSWPSIGTTESQFMDVFMKDGKIYRLQIPSGSFHTPKQLEAGLYNGINKQLQDRLDRDVNKLRGTQALAELIEDNEEIEENEEMEESAIAEIEAKRRKTANEKRIRIEMGESPPAYINYSVKNFNEFVKNPPEK